jgi:hypothetical protein
MRRDVECPICGSTNAMYEETDPEGSMKLMTDLPIERWLEWARRDDWHAYFVGSDIRQMLGEIERLREKTLRNYSDGDIAGEFHYRASLAKADEDGKRLAKEIDDYVDSHLVTDEQIDEVDKVLEAARPLVECPTCMRRFKLVSSQLSRTGE